MLSCGATSTLCPCIYQSSIDLYIRPLFIDDACRDMSKCGMSFVKQIAESRSSTVEKIQQKRTENGVSNLLLKTRDYRLQT